LETVEKREPVTGSGTASFSSDEVTKLTSELASLNERYTKFCDEANKQTITIAKHTEQLFRFERELVETKDILKTFMIKYDNFVQESNEKLADYEFAISEIEKSIAPTITTSIDDISSILPQEQNSPEVINPDDLKSLVKQELSGI
jgi:predicted  nucleic acid-binding Zn-ribbon protein